MGCMTGKSSCIFCQIVQGSIPAHILYSDDHYLALLDIHPLSPGHTLVIPKNHSSDLLDALPKDRMGLLEVVAKIAPAILKGVGAPAFNVGINNGRESGQVVFHTHVHIIPRKKGDGLSDWEGKGSLPEELSHTAEGIRSHL